MLISFTQLKNKYAMDIKKIIHVGGHFGEEVPEYIKNDITNITIFEPLKSNCAVIKQKIDQYKDASIVLHECALGNYNKQIDMFVSSNNKESSSILKPLLHLRNHPDVLFPSTELVDMKRLDDFNLECDLINMDVQGFELEVLKGGVNTVKTAKYVYCEVNRDYVYEGNALIHELDQFLSDFKRAETDWFAGGIWGDALYIRNT